MQGAPYTLLSTTLTTDADAVRRRRAALRSAEDASPTRRQGRRRRPTPAPPQDDAEVAFTQPRYHARRRRRRHRRTALAEAQAQVAELMQATSEAGERRFALPPQLLLDAHQPAPASTRSARSPTRPPASSRRRALRLDRGAAWCPRTSPTLRARRRRRRRQPPSGCVRARHGEPLRRRAARERRDAAKQRPRSSPPSASKHGESPVADGQKVILQYSDAEDPELGRRIARVDVYATNSCAPPSRSTTTAIMCRVAPRVRRSRAPPAPATPKAASASTRASTRPR